MEEISLKKMDHAQLKVKRVPIAKRRTTLSLFVWKKKQKERRIKQIDVQENYESETEENSNHDSDDSYDQAFGIKVNHVKIKQPKTEVNGQKCKLLVDTGSSINLYKSEHPPKLESNIVLYVVLCV